MASRSRLNTRLLRSSSLYLAALLFACGSSHSGPDESPANSGTANTDDSGAPSTTTQGGTGASSTTPTPSATSSSGSTAPTSSSGVSTAPTNSSAGSSAPTSSSSSGPASDIDSGPIAQGNDSGAGSGTGDGGKGAVAPDAAAGAPPTGGGVCDIFASASTPCVAAHSTVRALYSAYDGNLYQVTRASDNTTKDIGVLAAGGFANGATQDTFCAGTTCTITIIYDQSSQGNHLTPGPAGQHGTGADKPANATDLQTTASGHEVYGVRIRVGMGYRNDTATGTATGDEAETEYMVSSQNDLVDGCCYDYGNAETNNRDDGDATMEAVYFGGGSGQASGVGPGPWVEVDIENGLCAGVDANGAKEAKGVATNMSLPYNFATAVVVGRTGAAPGSFALYGADATTGTLQTMYDGARPNGYAPMKKQGAIILGIGGDNSNGAAGEFYEGVMTTGAATVATLDAVQANIVAAGYGK
jgi:non-reducing end alpha-L-arabinofuranosidase